MACLRRLVVDDCTWEEWDLFVDRSGSSLQLLHSHASWMSRSGRDLSVWRASGVLESDLRRGELRDLVQPEQREKLQVVGRGCERGMVRGRARLG